MWLLVMSYVIEIRHFVVSSSKEASFPLLVNAFNGFQMHRRKVVKFPHFNIQQTRFSFVGDSKTARILY